VAAAASVFAILPFWGIYAPDASRKKFGLTDRRGTRPAFGRSTADETVCCVSPAVRAAPIQVAHPTGALAACCQQTDRIAQLTLQKLTAIGYHNVRIRLTCLWVIKTTFSNVQGTTARTILHLVLETSGSYVSSEAAEDLTTIPAPEGSSEQTSPALLNIDCGRGRRHQLMISDEAAILARLYIEQRAG